MTFPRDIKLRPRTARELGIMQGYPPPPEKRPTLDNRDQPPFNRWSFQNVRSLIPTAEVSCGDTPAQLLQKDVSDFSDVSVICHDGRKETVGRILEATYSDGFLIVHRGKILFEKYDNGMGPQTLHLSQSVAKSLVGLLAGILHDRGLLDLQEPLGEIVPELKRCGYADASLHHVLDMQSGVRFSEDYGAPDSDMTRIDVASGWRPRPAGEPPHTIRDVILTLPQEREHGGSFAYRSIETDVIAWVLERITDRTLAELVSEEIWQEIGAERDACFTVDSAGTALADGGFNATLRDYARIGRLVLNEGRIGDRQILPSDWIQDMRRGESEKFGEPYNEIAPRGAYSRQWWIRDNNRGDIMARGVFGQLIYLDFESDFLAVKLSSWPDYVLPAFLKDTLAAIDAIRREIT
jgi:CubicO group peptidase (beta-lactamase class C family)